jgi:hypothetical protein
MPITTPADAADRYGGDRDHFRHVLDHLITPAVAQADHEIIRPISEGTDLIHAEIVKNLENADLVLCDISTLNANVFFELGIRTSLDRPTCLIRDEHTSLPFDTGGLNFHRYRSGLTPWHIEEDIERLAEHIRASAQRSRGRNTLWQYFGLTQRGVSAEKAAEDSGDTEKLDFILAEVQRLQRQVERDDADPHDTDRIDSFLAQARLLLADTQWTWVMVEGRMTIAVSSTPPPTIIAVLERAARDHGIDLAIRLGE